MHHVAPICMFCVDCALGLVSTGHVICIRRTTAASTAFPPLIERLTSLTISSMIRWNVGFLFQYHIWTAHKGSSIDAPRLLIFTSFLPHLMPLMYDYDPLTTLLMVPIYDLHHDYVLQTFTSSGHPHSAIHTARAAGGHPMCQSTCDTICTPSWQPPKFHHDYKSHSTCEQK